MNNVIVFLLFFLVGNNVFSQDTIVNHLTKQVKITDAKRKVEIIYDFKKSIENIHGNYQVISLSSKIKFEINCQYKNGKKNGIYKLFLNDTIAELFTFKKGKLNGRTKQFANGFISLKGKYKKNKKKGIWRYYFEDGKTIKAKGKYSGKYIVFVEEDNSIKLTFPDGVEKKILYSDTSSIGTLSNEYMINIILKENFLRIGEWKYYSKSKIIQKIKYYNSGKMKYNKVFDQNDYRYSITW